MRRLKDVLGVFVVGLTAIFAFCGNVHAEEMSEEFLKYLNDKGEFVVNAAKGDEEDLAMYLDFKYTNADLGYSVCWDKIAEDLSSFEFGINCWGGEVEPEKHTVKLKFNYDPEVSKTINDYLDEAINGKTKFSVSDLELVSYWLNSSGENNNNLALYSSELKKLLDYKNIQLFTDSRAGGSIPFTTGNAGFGSFQVDGISYRVEPTIGAYVEHIIYVDENVGDTQEDIVNAVQKRVDDYFGKGKVNIVFGGEGIYDYFISNYDSMISYHQGNIDNYQRLLSDYETNCENNPNKDEMMCEQNERYLEQASQRLTEDSSEYYLEHYKDEKASFIASWNTNDSDYEFLKSAYNDWYFSAEIDLGDRFAGGEFIVMKDSSKMVEPIMKTKDYATNIEISTSKILPLDTTIQAKELTSGEEYEKIIKKLNLDNNLTFDLKLYSNSLDEYITKLDNGEFEVRIPLVDDFKNKDLMAYYVDDKGEKQEYKVDVKDGYAIFNTNHFSIYTLGYKKIDNPKTFDSIGSSLVMIMLSILGLVGITLKFCKNKISL